MVMSRRWVRGGVGAGGGWESWWRARQADWRQAGVQYRCRPVAGKGWAQTGQVAVVSLSLRSGGIGWLPFR
jgi:hypothetical protein